MLGRQPRTEPATAEPNDRWLAAWPAALAAWSRYVQLHEPHWCLTPADEKRYLSASFAMIRLTDHTIYIGLRGVELLGLEAFATEILAHEIGHHVYCPGDLTDNARLLARTRAGLPTREAEAPRIANLYADLLINDRLQRQGGLNIAGVYQALRAPDSDSLWQLYMRIYEVLWNLQTGTLACTPCAAGIHRDAVLGARLIRSYARDWLDGAGRFACLCLPYLLADDAGDRHKLLEVWHDTRDAGAGGVPDGLAEIEAGELEGAIHPIEDPALSGLPDDTSAAATDEAHAGRPSPDPSAGTGVKSLKRLRQPFEYLDVVKATGASLSDAELVARYYRELAIPHIIPFPVSETPPSIDPHPEGLEMWDIGAPVEDVDWIGSLWRSPHLIPGLTTVQRVFGSSPGPSPEPRPLDLYLGVDCSGSMGDPAQRLSYPVLAGAVMALSALRAGARVMVALSGEPGRTITTDGFVRDERLVLATLTDYLGTGMTFGIHRLADTFGPSTSCKSPTHILIVTDNDIFDMLDRKGRAGVGWDVARRALGTCGGGGTFLLQIPAHLAANRQAKQVVSPGVERMQTDGWSVAFVDSEAELLAFARTFSRTCYGRRADIAATRREPTRAT